VVVRRVRAEYLERMPADRAAPPPKRTLVEDIGVQRRAPFGDNPSVGVRGARTQQRILLAALEVFDQLGYHACRVDAITAAAGCSRPSFYQYFSSKEDLFRQLAGVVAREQYRITDEMGDVTPDADGWKALRAWVDAIAAVYETYRPVFTTFAAAAGSDEVVASGAARVGSRMTRTIATKVDPLGLKAFTPAQVHLLLSNGVTRVMRHRENLVIASPDRAPDRDRTLDALTDVLHRSLFGRRGVTMVEHRDAPVRRRASRLPVPPTVAPSSLGPTGQATYTKLLDAAAATFTALGFHDARVDDIVTAAGTSHGTFYRYFENKDVVFRAVAWRIGRRLFDVLVRIPDVGDAPSAAASTRKLRSWMAEYGTTWRQDGAIFRLWMEAVRGDEVLGSVTYRSMDAVLQAFTAFLAHRDFGDLEVDAFLLLATLDLDPPGADPLPVSHDEFLLQVVRRGFLGIDTRA
jgi:AcrR family transcriptional regulator